MAKRSQLRAALLRTNFEELIADLDLEHQHAIDIEGKDFYHDSDERFDPAKGRRGKRDVALGFFRA